MLVPIGFALRHGGLVGEGRGFQGAHGGDALLPVVGSGFADRELSVHHQEGVITVGNGGNQLCLHGLAVGFALQEGGPGASAGVEQVAEEVDFPTGSNRKLVRASRCLTVFNVP